MARRGGILILLLAGLAACGPRTEPPAPVTIHAGHDALRTPAQETAPPPVQKNSAPEPAIQRDSAAAPRAVRDSGERITVQNGDTLYAVSRRTGVPVRD